MNPFSSAVNQKLFLADLLIRQANPEQDDFGHINMALSQSALFQLQCAYQLYLNEIASNYKVSNTLLIKDVEGLSNALLAIDKYPSESAEIKNLLDDKESWLFRMFSEFQRISEPHSLAGVDKSAIPVQRLDEGGTAQQLDLKQVFAYLVQFRELLERQRGLMIEC